MSIPHRKPLGEILVGLQVLTPAEVECVLEALRRRADRSKFGQVAREMGLVQEEHILAALAVQMELYPGLRNLSLSRLLQRLRGADPEPPTGRSASPASSVGTAPIRLNQPRS